MEIYFKSKRLAKEFEKKDLKRKHGELRSKKIMQRLAEMAASDNLEILHKLPGPRCHQLTNNLDEQFSLDLDHPYRLIIEVADEPIPRKEDKGISLQKVSKVCIIEITNTHGRTNG